MVTATDPAGGTEGGTTEQAVTITIKDVNEAPMISGGFTRNSQLEYDDGTDGTEEEVAEAVTAAKEVATYTATDPEITEEVNGMPVSWPVAHGR